MAACRSSGVLTASALVFTGQCKLISIHATSVGAPALIKVWDNTAASGKEVARITLAPDSTIEFDMHGIICATGLYLEEVSGAMACSVEYA